MSTEMTEYVPLGFEELAAKITRDRMLHFGYTPEQINEAEAEDHARCDWNGDERHCLGEDHKSLHPVADELNATAESVVFVLEYVMRPVAEVRARLVEVEAELAAARSLLTQARIDEYAERKHRAAVEADREAWRPVVELVRLVVEHQRPGTPAGPDWESRRDRLWTSLVAAVDALPGADR